MIRRLTMALFTVTLTSSAIVRAHEGLDDEIARSITTAAAQGTPKGVGQGATVEVEKAREVSSTPADPAAPDVRRAGGAAVAATMRGDRTTAITWKTGTTPAAAADASAARAAGDEAAAIESWLKGYDAAFNARDLDTLAAFYHPDVTIYEGGGINTGWADYRDRHLGPELKALENLQFGHSSTKVSVLPGGRSAYATSEYSIKARMGERAIDARGLETLVLVKGADGTWKIRHSHTSSRPARKPSGD